MTPIRIGIIGGGPGGLFTAKLLRERVPAPIEVVLFEAGDRLGGKVQTSQFHFAPVRYEAGAAELYDYSGLGHDPLKELVAELGLTIHPLEGGAVVLDGQVLHSPNDLPPASRAAIRRFHRRACRSITPAEYYESDWKADNEEKLSNTSFRNLLATIDDPLARRYVEVAVHSDIAAENHRTSAMYGLQNWLMVDERYMRLYRIAGGNELLTAALARTTTAEIRLKTRIESVERAAGNYRVRTNSKGTIREEEFDFVVAALPNNWIPRIDWRGEKLNRAMERHHAHYDHPAHYLRVTVLFNKPYWHEQIASGYFMVDAYGGCCVYDETPRDGSSEHGVLGWLLGGDAAQTLSNLTDAELVERVLETLPASWGDAKGQTIEGRVHRWIGAVNALPGGRPLRSLEDRHRPEPTEHARLYVVGDYLHDSTLNGVLDSAEFVAECIAEQLVPTPAAPASIAAYCEPSTIPPIRYSPS